MFNRITLIGNLGTDPESRELENGSTVTSFSVATNRRWTNQDGSQGEETTWFRVSAWNGLGQVCQEYLHKGRQVFIEGTLVPDRETGGPRVWEDKEGNPRASFELRADTMKMLGARPDEQEEAEPVEVAAPRKAAAASRGNGQKTAAAPHGNGQKAAAAPRKAARTRAAKADYDDMPF